MPYIDRLPDNSITGLYGVAQSPEMTEWLSEDAPEVIAYRSSSAPKPTLSKVTILDRLNAAGLLPKAFAAMGGPGSYVYERWQASPDAIDTTNPLVHQVLDAIGADKSVILTP